MITGDSLEIQGGVGYAASHRVAEHRLVASKFQEYRQLEPRRVEYPDAESENSAPSGRGLPGKSPAEAPSMLPASLP